MFRPVLLICAILSFFTLVQNFCIEPAIEPQRQGTVYAVACVKSKNYTNDVQKIPTKSKDGDMIVVFSVSDIPILVNHGFAPLADILSYLMLSRSGLKTIEDDAFAGLTKMKRLYLGFNELTEVKATWFKDMGDLEGLDIERNRIAHFDPNVFQHLPKLSDLDVSKNRLRCFDVENLKTLNATTVDIARNPYDWICAVPLMKWSKENGKEMFFYDDVEKVAFECYDRITNGPNKSNMLDDCINAKLDEAIKNPDLLEINSNGTKIQL